MKIVATYPWRSSPLIAFSSFTSSPSLLTSSLPSSLHFPTTHASLEAWLSVELVIGQASSRRTDQLTNDPSINYFLPPFHYLPSIFLHCYYCVFLQFLVVGRWSFEVSTRRHAPAPWSISLSTPRYTTSLLLVYTFYCPL